MDEKLEKQREQKRRWAKKNYEKNREEMRKTSAERYRKKKKESGIPQRPRGRPKIERSPEQIKKIARDKNQIAYYTSLIRKGQLPDIDNMNMYQLKNLLFAIMKEQKRCGDQNLGVQKDSKDSCSGSNTAVEEYEKSFWTPSRNWSRLPSITIEYIVSEE